VVEVISRAVRACGMCRCHDGMQGNCGRQKKKAKAIAAARLRAAVTLGTAKAPKAIGCEQRMTLAVQ
jgi:hypothetical protein